MDKKALFDLKSSTSERNCQTSFVRVYDIDRPEPFPSVTVSVHTFAVSLKPFCLVKFDEVLIPPCDVVTDVPRSSGPVHAVV